MANFFKHYTYSNYWTLLILLIFFLKNENSNAQNFNGNGGIMLSFGLTIGNHNQTLKAGAFAFGVLSVNDISIESGLSILSYTFLKRHTVSNKGFAFSYEFFALAGLGNNNNLLGSSVSNLNDIVLFVPQSDSNFSGFGFGFTKDFLPNELSKFNVRRGQFLMRFSNANHNIHLAFTNDSNPIKLFNGQGTDFGLTGTLNVGFTQITNTNSLYQLGLGLELFTPKQDFNKLPRNPINSDDGRKNVWFTEKPFNDLFYGNIYGYGYYQNKSYSVKSKLGVNSQKAGAYVQNILHDGAGLNPRFPWNVTTEDKVFYEVSSSVFTNTNLR